MPVTPQFASPVSNPFGFQDVEYDSVPSFGDLDGDGDFDAIVGNEGGQLNYFQNTGNSSNPQFAESVTAPFGVNFTSFDASPSLVNLDGDDDLDLVIGDTEGETYYFQNTGNSSNPQFAASVSNAFGLQDVGSYSQPRFVDLDADGDFDAAIGNYNGDIFYFYNTGDSNNPQFATPVTVADVVPYQSAPSFVDLDADGDFDAVIGESRGFLHYAQNTGNSTNPQFAALVGNQFGLTRVDNTIYNTTPTFVDLDGDGDLDAFVGEYYGNILYYENTTPPPNQPPVIAPGQTFAIEENSPNDTSVGTVQATEPDEGQSLTYDITNGNPDTDGDGEAVFAIDSTTGEITVNDSDDLNFEVTSEVTLAVEVTDSGATPETATEDVVISLTNIAEDGADDYLFGTLGNDNIDGLGGNDTIKGNYGADYLSGSEGKDLLIGNAGNDVLIGGAGNDRLRGLNGADVIVGGSGRNSIFGGRGADQIVFDSPTNAFNIIRDFKNTEGDILQFDTSQFTALDFDTFSVDNFVENEYAQDADDFLIYDRGTFEPEPGLSFEYADLYYDADGNGAQEDTWIASFDVFANFQFGFNDIELIQPQE